MQISAVIQYLHRVIFFISLQLFQATNIVSLGSIYFGMTLMRPPMFSGNINLLMASERKELSHSP